MALNLMEAIGILEGGDWCALRVITANVKKGTGGKVLEIPKARIARNRAPVTSYQLPDTGNRQQATGNRNPNHGPNATRNIEIAANKSIITIHPILITHINQQAVL